MNLIEAYYDDTKDIIEISYYPNIIEDLKTVLCSYLKNDAKFLKLTICIYGERAARLDEIELKEFSFENFEAVRLFFPEEGDVLNHLLIKRNNGVFNRISPQGEPTENTFKQIIIETYIETYYESN